MKLLIEDEDVEFEMSRSSETRDVLLGINIKKNSESVDILVISIRLTADEFEQLKQMVEDRPSGGTDQVEA